MSNLFFDYRSRITFRTSPKIFYFLQRLFLLFGNKNCGSTTRATHHGFSSILHTRTAIFELGSAIFHRIRCILRNLFFTIKPNIITRFTDALSFLNFFYLFFFFHNLIYRFTDLSTQFRSGFSLMIFIYSSFPCSCKSLSISSLDKILPFDSANSFPLATS